jgi:chromosome segregation ATPase
MAGDRFFRSAFMGGYNKEDVNRYIEGQSVKNAELIQSLQTAAGDAATELDALKKEVDSLKEELSQARATRAQMDEQQADFNRQVRRLTDQSAALENEKQAERQVAAALRAKYSDLQKAHEALQQEHLQAAEKARDYDRMRESVADVLLNARRTADEMIGEAKTRADDLREESDKRMDTLSGNLQAIRARAVLPKEKLEEAYRAVSKALDEFTSSLDHVEELLQKSGHSRKATPEQRSLEAGPQTLSLSDRSVEADPESGGGTSTVQVAGFRMPD